MTASSPAFGHVPANAVGFAAPASASIPTIPPKKEVPWKPTVGPLTQFEKALIGTWTATVGDYASRSRFMSDKVMFGTAPGGGLAGIVDGIRKDNRIKTDCIWLEFYDTRKGMRRECTLVNGEANALKKVDFLTGAKSRLGTTFEWSSDARANEIRCHFDEDMLVAAADGEAVNSLNFRTWTLRFGKAIGEKG
jgi:hypothetical protein